MQQVRFTKLGKVGSTPSCFSKSPRRHPAICQAQQKNAANVLPTRVQVVPVLLAEEKGVGVGILAIAVIAGAVKIVAKGVNSIAAAVDRELKTTRAAAPDATEEWRKQLLEAMGGATANATDYLREVRSNVSEAIDILKRSVDGVTAQLSKEAEIGAANWEKTVLAMNVPAAVANDKGLVARLAEAEVQGVQRLRAVAKEVKELASKDKATGWGEHLLDKEKPPSEN